MSLYQMNRTAQTRWASFENPRAAKGAGATANRGAKGAPCEPIKPGETKTLVEIEGSGVINRIWLTLSERDPVMLRSLRLDAYWDGASTPAVSVPLGDFFGLGLGHCIPFENELFSNPEGRSFNCFIPMPFRTGARLTLTNESDQYIAFLFYDVDMLIDVEHNDDTLYFHAHWRRENRNQLGKAFAVLPRVEGAGRYIGCNIGCITAPEYGSTWWGEGELKLWLDGDGEHPTLCGTGSEDLPGTAWGMGAYAHRTQGCPIVDNEKRHYCFYRYHTIDPVYFHEDCRISIDTIGCDQIKNVIAIQGQGAPLVPVATTPPEVGIPIPMMDRPQPVDLTDPEFADTSCIFFRQDDWSSTAYFYLDRPENGLPALAQLEERTAGLAS